MSSDDGEEVVPLEKLAARVIAGGGGEGVRGREGGEEGRKGGREGRKEGREGGRKGGERGREGSEGGKEGGRDGERERKMEREREGGRRGMSYKSPRLRPSGIIKVTTIVKIMYKNHIYKPPSD